MMPVSVARRIGELNDRPEKMFSMLVSYDLIGADPADSTKGERAFVLISSDDKDPTLLHAANRQLQRHLNQNSIAGLPYNVEIVRFGMMLSQ
jgi:hypothetical protein